MKRVTVLFGRVKDPGAFKAHYQATHVPLVKQLPGLAGFAYVTAPELLGEESGAPYELIAYLDFASDAALGEALTSAAGAATVEDVALFASGGATLLVSDLIEVAHDIQQT